MTCCMEHILNWFFLWRLTDYLPTLPIDLCRSHFNLSWTVLNVLSLVAAARSAPPVYGSGLSEWRPVMAPDETTHCIVILFMKVRELAFLTAYLKDRGVGDKHRSIFSILFFPGGKCSNRKVICKQNSAWLQFQYICSAIMRVAVTSESSFRTFSVSAARCSSRDSKLGSRRCCCFLVFFSSTTVLIVVERP